MNSLPKCKQTSCTLRSKCQRYDEAGNYLPIMPFLPEGATSLEDEEVQTVNGCADYWPAGTGVEWFESEVIKTPVPDEK